MGFSVLYVAFAIVALWLLGEVLLQYKARLRWRVLAFAGFLGVAAGVAMHQIAVIILGAVAFGVGQSYVTLSYKRGFAAGWALEFGGRGRPKAPAAFSDPVLAVSAVEEDGGAVAAGADAEGRADQLADPGGARQDVYQPQPMHDDSGEYPQYGGPQQNAPYGGGPATDPYAGGGYGGAGGYDDGWGTGRQPAAASYGYDTGQSAPAGQDPYAPGYGWSGDQFGYSQQPAAASYGYDQSGYPQQQPAGGYDSGYDTGGYSTGDWTPQPAADPYGYGYGYPQDPQGQQPYVPQQQPYDPPPPPYEQQAQQPADPYDPYRY